MAKTKTTPDESNLWNEYKRQSIQTAVIRLMCREGFDAVTMERVAQEVGIAKGTVYLHYRDKQDLLDAVKETALEPLSSKLDEVVRTEGDPERRLRMYSLRYLTYFDENRDLFRILIYERAASRVTMANRYNTDRYKRMIAGVSSMISEGIEGGAFRPGDVRKLAAMYIESNIAIVTQRLQTMDNGPVEDDAQLVADVFLKGIEDRTPKKRRVEARRSTESKGKAK
jgi:AcrR family transcriptional regulator